METNSIAILGRLQDIWMQQIQAKDAQNAFAEILGFSFSGAI